MEAYFHMSVSIVVVNTNTKFLDEMHEQWKKYNLRLTISIK